MKLLGSLLVMTGGALTWYLQMRERKQHQELLEDILYSLRRMGEEIRQIRTPLPRILERLKEEEGDAAVFFAAVTRGIQQGDLLETAWEHAVRELLLKSSEKEVLLNLGNSLRGDEENACKAISLAVYELAKQAEETVRRRPEVERRASALCFSAAALLVILLI